MPIVGRDLDVSERKVAFQWQSSTFGQSLITGNAQFLGLSTLVNMFMIPFPCTLQSGAVYSAGLSGAPQFALNILRWAAGSTTFALGISNMVLTTFGTSGVQGLSGLPAAGSTLLNLQQGDILQIVTAGTGGAGQLMLELVVKKTQDIVAYNNVST